MALLITAPELSASAQAEVPDGFETREVGTILSILPELSSSGGMINLVMTPEVVADPVWQKYTSTYTDSHGKERKATMETPFFRTSAVSTTISLNAGETILMSGGAPAPGKDKVVYTFVTANLINLRGEVIDIE